MGLYVSKPPTFLEGGGGRRPPRAGEAARIVVGGPLAFLPEPLGRDLGRDVDRLGVRGVAGPGVSISIS